MKISISRTASVNLKKIFWDIFFRLKNRGVLLERHFPWLEDTSTDATFFEATKVSVSVGGLVLREIKYFIDEKELKIGLIGLVCVIPESRGIGVAGALLKEAISYAEKHGFDYLTLWTNQHKIYLPHGFYLIDNWCFGWINASSKQKKAKADLSFQSHLFVENRTLPLPPFADSIYEYSVDNISFTFLNDKDGVVVVWYEGEVTEVAHAMIEVFPAQWRLNVVKDDPLIHALASCGANVDLRPVNLQMWLNLDHSDPSGDRVGRIKMSVLDRI
jgi:GNAT superfamily N-acetyltransferase